jgi:hypothetical protein
MERGRKFFDAVSLSILDIHIVIYLALFGNPLCDLLKESCSLEKFYTDLCWNFFTLSNFVKFSLKTEHCLKS